MDCIVNNSAKLNGIIGKLESYEIDLEVLSTKQMLPEGATTTSMIDKT